MKKVLLAVALSVFLLGGFRVYAEEPTYVNDISKMSCPVAVCGSAVSQPTPLPVLIYLDGVIPSRQMSWKEYDIFISGVAGADYRDDNGILVPYNPYQSLVTHR